MKLFQSLKFQFIAFFSVFIIALSVVTAVLGVHQLTSAVEETFAAQGFYLVEKASKLIDGNKFEALANSLNIDDPFYEETRLKLKDLKESSNCVYLYTIAPYRGDFWHYIIDGSAEPDDEDHFSPLGDEVDISEYCDAFRLVVKNNITAAGDLTFQGDWGWLVSVYAPIFNSNGRLVGVIACDFDGTRLKRTIAAGEKQKLIIGLISVLVGIALLLFFLQRIFTPLSKIITILKEVSLGEGDLTKRITIHKENEIGELANYFNMTLDKIKKLVVIIKAEAAHLHTTGNDLAYNMHGTANAVHHITDSLQNVRQKVINQSASVTETHATMEEVTANIERLDKNVERQTESVSQSSSAIEEMLANIQSVTQTLIRNAENVDELIKASDIGRSSLQKVTQDIQEIAHESEGLLAINVVMENIASQTSLLSMNAAIEAAHAGETGKGFAVVAAEIRKLANSSTEQSKTISDVLKKIKTAIDEMTISTNMVSEKFTAIDERVHVVSDQEINIRNAMEEQGQGSKQILDAVSVLNEKTQMVKQGSMKMLEGSNEVIRESESLEKATIEISEAMNEMTTGAEEIKAAISHVNEISKKTKEYIEILVSEVSKFKVD